MCVEWINELSKVSLLALHSQASGDCLKCPNISSLNPIFLQICPCPQPFHSLTALVILWYSAENSIVRKTPSSQSLSFPVSVPQSPNPIYLATFHFHSHGQNLDFLCYLPFRPFSWTSLCKPFVFYALHHKVRLLKLLELQITRLQLKTSKSSCNQQNVIHTYPVCSVVLRIT